MWYTAFALLMTIFMGAIIAYYGDLIGRKYGKKRLSWFGLRPKYTAILITSISGAFISTFTMAILFLLVPTIRQIIMEGEAAIRQKPVLEKQNLELERKRAAAEVALARTRDQLRPLETQLAEMTKRLDAEAAKLREVHAQLKAAQGDARLARAERDSAQKLEAKAMSQYAQVVAKRAELQKQNADLAKINHDLAEANVALNETNTALKATNATLSNQNKTLSLENARQAKLNGEYTQQNQEIARQNESLMRENGDLEKKRISIAQRTKDLSDYNAELEQRNAKLIETARQILGGYKSLRDAYNASRVKRVVVHKDEDLARIVVPARSGPDDVRKIVQNLLSEASQSAITRGAATGDQVRAVQVANRVVASSDDGEDVVPVSGDERVDELVRKLAYQPDPVCLLAVAVANSVEEEPAAIELIPRPNKEIYSRGQEVAVHRINAGLPVERLFDDIVGFLRSLGQSAVQQGVIPRTDAAGEPQVGSLTAAEIAKLVEKVREYNGTVRIRAVAASDIRAADPLALTFKVAP